MADILAYSQKFEDHKVCVLLPTYNNAATLAQVIRDVLEYTSHVIVVNDGSTDETESILKGFDSIQVISYVPNVGKGWALRKGFGYALKMGYEYAITLDSDGQHFAKDLPKFIAKLEAEGPAIIIGARNMGQAAVPGKSSFGHKFSNFWFFIETGIKAPDTQSGYRLYPLIPLQKINFHTKKYEFEIEVLVRAAWKGVHISSVPVTVYYAPREIRISHFRPFKDFSRISVLNTVLVFLTFAYIYPAKFLKSLFQKKTYKEFLNQIFNPDEPVYLKSLSVAFGVLMGILPIWGFQLVLAIFLALVFRLNKGLVIISANISLPPMIPLIIYLSYKIGAWWQGPQAVQLGFDKELSVKMIHLNFMQYLYGSISLAIMASFFFGIATYIILTIFKKSRKTTLHG
jgi:glycosyltransferase involved in cell wall biosynthesis